MLLTNRRRRKHNLLSGRNYLHAVYIHWKLLPSASGYVYGCKIWQMSGTEKNEVDISWNNCFRKSFNVCRRERVGPLLFSCSSVCDQCPSHSGHIITHCKTPMSLMQEVTLTKLFIKNSILLTFPKPRFLVVFWCFSYFSPFKPSKAHCTVCCVKRKSHGIKVDKSLRFIFFLRH